MRLSLMLRYKLQLYTELTSLLPPTVPHLSGGCGTCRPACPPSFSLATVLRANARGEPGQHGKSSTENWRGAFNPHAIRFGIGSSTLVLCALWVQG